MEGKRTRRYADQIFDMQGDEVREDLLADTNPSKIVVEWQSAGSCVPDPRGGGG